MPPQREPQQLEPYEIEHVLGTQSIGRLGCHAPDAGSDATFTRKEAFTYIIPVSYVYDPGEKCIYGYLSDGRKTRMMGENPKVCFEVEDVESAYNWRCVIVWGEFAPLHGAEADHALRMLSQRLRPIITSVTSLPPGVSTTETRGVVYRIQLGNKDAPNEEYMSGREERR